jgi:hypothetical protein
MATGVALNRSVLKFATLAVYDLGGATKPIQNNSGLP